MATTKKTGMDMDDVVVQGKGDVRKPEDMVDVYALPDKKYVKLRPFGSVHPYQGHWIETKKKDGGKGTYYYPCAAFDIESGQADSTKHCPFCSDESGLVRTSTDYFFNAIHRREQQNKPVKIRATAGETESGFKEKSSESWTPVKAVRVTGATLRKIQALKQLNTVENADGDSVNYGVSHPKYGADISIKKDKDLPPATMYDVQFGAQTALTKEERAYLIWDLNALMVTPTEKDAESEYMKWATRMGLKKAGPAKGKKSVDADDDGDDEDEDDEDTPKAKVKAKVTPKAKKPAAADEDDDFDEDEEEDTPKAKGKAKPAPAKSKKVVDEDDDLDDDEDDEDDEPAPKAKGKAKPAPAKGKKPAADEDDDFDDEDDEEDEPAPKKKAAPAKGKKVVDEDEEDDEDDEDDEPVAKKKPAPAKGKKVVDEDDEDDFDDEDDEPAPKKKAAPSKGKKVVDEDDEDDFDDEEDEPAPKKKVVAKKR